MRDEILLTVSVVTDDSTGIWNVGELEYGVRGTCATYLEQKPENRDKLADWLAWLSDACDKGAPPFGPLP